MEGEEREMRQGTARNRPTQGVTHGKRNVLSHQSPHTHWVLAKRLLVPNSFHFRRRDSGESTIGTGGFCWPCSQTVLTLDEFAQVLHRFQLKRLTAEVGPVLGVNNRV